MTWFAPSAAALLEPLALTGGIATFLLMASLAAAPAGGPRSLARGSTETGPLALEATLSQSKLASDEDGTLLLHVRLRGATPLGPLPIDLALVLDTAATMAEGDKLALMSQACLEVSRQLRRDDRVTVVSFADEARTVLAPGVADMGPLVPGTGRNLSGGLALAASELRRSARPGAIRRVLLVTGGKPDRGITDREGLRALVASLSDEGISLSTLGLGLDYDAALLKTLSDAGGGSYHHADGPERLAGIYAAELRSLHALVARRVRVDLGLAPGVVLEDMVEWTTSEDHGRTSVLVGDFEGDHSAKVIARLRVPAGLATEVVSVSLEGQDARTQTLVSLPAVQLGVGRTKDRNEVLASRAQGIGGDLEDAEVVLELRRAEECARRRDADGARAALASIRRIRPTLEYQAADGKLERETVDSLEGELLWFAARGGEAKGTLSSLVENAKETVTGLIAPRKNGNESAAIGALKTIGTSEAIFREGDKDGNGVLDYGSLELLSKTGLVDSVLGSGTKQGYVFSAHVSTKTPEFLWYATAFPATPGTTGDRYFFINQSGVIFYGTSPFDVDPETCEVKPQRWDRRAEKFVESYVIPTGK
jgi:hypothetical protein